MGNFDILCKLKCINCLLKIQKINKKNSVTKLYTYYTYVTMVTQMYNSPILQFNLKTNTRGGHYIGRWGLICLLA